MTYAQEYRWGFLNPMLPLACALGAGVFAASQLDVAPAMIIFLITSVSTYLLVSFTLHLIASSWQCRILSRLRNLDSETLMMMLEDEPWNCEAITMVLLSRGAPKAKLADHALSLLLSSSAEDRWSGWCTLNDCFPHVKERLIALDSGIRQKLVEIEYSNPPEGTVQTVGALRAKLTDFVDSETPLVLRDDPDDSESG